MDVYFIRHKISGGPKTIRELKNRSVIAYHFVDEYYEDIDGYSEPPRGLVQAFNAFGAIGKTGAIIVSEYDNSNEFTVGTFDPGVTTQPMQFQTDEGELLYKTLKYRDPKTFRYSDYPLLAAIRPPYSTICSTGRSFSQLIKHIYLGDEIEMGTDFMHPSSIELMCETFLRSDLAPDNLQLAYTLLRTGKTMPSVDIFGKSKEGEFIFAQVTYAANNPAKVKALVDFAGNKGTTVLFSKDKSVENEELDHHFNIDDIFQKFMEHGSVYRQMLEEMTGKL